MIALVVILIILLILFGFLLTPVSLYVDTDQGRYEIFQTPVFLFCVVIKNDTIIPRMRLVGINVPLQSKSKTKHSKKTDKNPKKKSAFKKSVSAWRFLVWKLLRSFDIEQAIVDLDTDNFVLNAQLVPVCFWASHGPVQVNTNFNGRVYFHLEARNRPARILWILLQFLTKK